MMSADAARTRPGYDVLGLFVGSEGMLGVVVEAVVKLLPRPPSAEVMLAAFSNLRDCAEAVAAVIADGIIPAGLEMMDNPAIRAAESFAHAGYPTDAAAILICELDGHPDDVRPGAGADAGNFFRQRRGQHCGCRRRRAAGKNVGGAQGGRFRRRGRCRRIIIAWTAPFRASGWRKC